MTINFNHINSNIEINKCNKSLGIVELVLMNRSK